MRKLVCSLLVLACLPAGAEIYKYTDERGNTVFTNQPPSGVSSQPIHLPPANTIQGADSLDAATPSSEPSSATAPYQHLTLSNLPDDEAMRANNGSFSVEVRLMPPLQPSHQLQLLVDGQPHGNATHSLRLPAQNLDRGEHSLAVQVISGQDVIQQSDSVSVNVQRVNTNHSPALRPPVRPRSTP